MKKIILQYINNLPNRIAAVLFTVVLFIFTSACSHEKNEVVGSFSSENDIPTMQTWDVNMIHSDSGVPRLRMKTKEWLMYDKASEPYWLFPKGLYAEKLDSVFQAEAYIQCDTALRYTNKDLWVFSGNVEIKNLTGRRLFTQKLYWDRIKKKMYSDVYTHMELEDGAFVDGKNGFESDERMNNFVGKQIVDGDAGDSFLQKMTKSDSVSVVPVDSLRTDSVKSR